MALYDRKYGEYLKQLWRDAHLGDATFPEGEDTQNIIRMLQAESTANLSGPRLEFVSKQLRLLNEAFESHADAGMDVRIPADFQNQLRTHRVATEKSLGIKNPGATLRDVHFESDFAELPTRTVGLGDLPPLADPEAWRRQMRDIESRAEEAVRKRMGDDYVHDPFNMQLGSLHWKERQPFLEEIEKHIGLRHLLDAGHGPAMFNREAGMMQLAPELMEQVDQDPRLAYLARQSVQYRPNRANVSSISEQYSLSGRVGRLDAVENDAFQRFLESPGKYAVMDVESAGLNPRHGSWQWFARVVDPEAGVVGEHNIYFKNKTMQSMGVLGGDRLRTLEEAAAGDRAVDFTAENIMPWLRELQDVEYVVGHNLEFDYGQFFHSLTHLSEYNDKTSEYHQLARNVLEKFYDPETRQIKNFIDTHKLSQRALADIEVSPDLVGHGTKFSLQNLLMQTDLLERARDAEGSATLDDWLVRGTHAADVDVPIEHHLFEALIEQATTEEGGLRYASLADPTWRDTIAKSQALGPMIDMTDFHGQIHEDLIEPLLRASLGDTANPGIVFDASKLQHANLSTPEDILAFVQEAVANGMSRREALKAAGISDAVQTINLNPMMQMIHQSRFYEPPPVGGPLIPEGLGVFDTTTGAAKNIFEKLKETFISPPPLLNPSILEVAHEAGSWRQLSQDFISDEGLIERMHGKFPTPEVWAAQQRHWADRGIPFAGSSWLERHLMSALGTTNVVNSEENALRQAFGDVIAPMGHWIASKEVDVISEGRVVKIPEWMLHEAERAEVFHTEEGVARTAFDAADRTQFYSLSPFRHEGGEEVSLMFRFGEGEQGIREREKLFGFLKERAGRKGYESVSHESGILEALEQALAHQDSQLFGVQVGTLGGIGDKARTQGTRANATRIHKILEDILGTEKDTVNSVFVGATSELPAGGLEGVPSTIKTVGAVIRPDLLSDAENLAFTTQAETAQALAKKAEGLGWMTKPLRTFAERNVTGSEIDSAMRNIGRVSNIKRRAPLIALAAATTAAGYYAHKRHRDNRLYNATLDFQPPEDEGWYDEYDSSMKNRHRPVISRGNKSQPMETAGLTRILDRNKTQHTKMGGADKYGYLFNTGGI